MKYDTGQLLMHAAYILNTIRRDTQFNTQVILIAGVMVSLSAA